MVQPRGSETAVSAIGTRYSDTKGLLIPPLHHNCQVSTAISNESQASTCAALTCVRRLPCSQATKLPAASAATPPHSAGSGKGSCSSHTAIPTARAWPAAANARSTVSVRNKVGSAGCMLPACQLRPVYRMRRKVAPLHSRAQRECKADFNSLLAP